MPIHDVTIGVFALTAVLGLIWLVQRGVRAGGLGWQGQAGRLRLIQSVPIDQRRRLVLVQLDGRDIVLLTGGAGDLLVAALPAVPHGAGS